MTRAIEVYQVDAFTTRPFCGNPAGVVPDAAGLTPAEMQLVAREMNLSETAFVAPVSGAAAPAAVAGRLRVRFFTPRCEVDLCGHATIATFHLLCELGRIPLHGGRARIEQVTGAGVLAVEIDAGPDAAACGAGPRVMMTQARPARRGPLCAADEQELARLLGVPPADLGIAGEAARGAAVGGAATGGAALHPEPISTGLWDLIVPVASPAALGRLSPHLDGLAAFCRARDLVSVHPFAAAGAGRATCRDFSPAVGVPEEAATGTASGALGAYLAFNRALGAPAEGAFNLTCEQGANLGRPSTIDVEVACAGGAPVAVRVGGRAVTVMRGSMVLPSP